MANEKNLEKIVQSIISEYLDFYQDAFADTELRVLAISDTEKHHYLLYKLGWYEGYYVHQCLFHFEIVKGKIWIQQNTTEHLVGEELVNKGVDKNMIVLGLQRPDVRPYTGFAVA